MLNAQKEGGAQQCLTRRTETEQHAIQFIILATTISTGPYNIKKNVVL